MFSVHRPASEGPMLYACGQTGVDRLAVKCAWNGCCTYNVGLVHWVIQRDYHSVLPYAELLHEGQIALWQAVLRYDPARGFRLAFSTRPTPCPPSAAYRTPWRRRSVRGVMQCWPSHRIWPNWLCCLAPPRSAGQAALPDILSCLTARHDDMIVAAYDLDGEPLLSLAAIGRLYGVSRGRVRVT